MNAKHYLRYADSSEVELVEIFFGIVAKTPFLTDALGRAQDLNLPNWRVVSGALYNTVWNHLTGRDETFGIKDVDLMYFDSDTSWEAEDKVIKSATGFAENPPIEIRNQARVHLWYEQHFGRKITPFQTVESAIDAFACTTHCVGVHQSDQGLDLYAPFGLRDIFAFTLRPNPIQDNRKTHEAKAARALKYWPELTVISWPENS